MPTSNPVPSYDPSDLIFNAEKLDQVVSGTGQYYTDRKGVNRRTLAGIDAAADNVLNSIGYAVPMAYAAGISLTTTSQTVEYSGVVYAPKSSSLPFTTSGAFETAKFRTVQVTDAAYLSYTPAGTGAVATTVQRKLSSSLVNLHDFLPSGYVLDGSVDYTTQTQAALNHLATSAASKLEFPQGFTLRLTGPVSMRAAGKVIDGTGVNLILASSTAGFLIAGDRNRVIGFRCAQSDQALTPTAIYIYNDETTTVSNYNRIIGVTGYNVYRGIHVYMGNTSAGAAAYRQSIYDCEFINQHQPKAWAGSFGICFDGPGAGNAGGNDSRCVNCYVKGYEHNYIVNNSVATSFVTCSGDGGAYCFKYAGNSSGLRLIGGYYEYNDYLIRVNDGVKYDAYILYPSVANTVNTQITGDGISLVSGGWSVGTGNASDIKNGWFQSNAAGTAEIYAKNGTSFYYGVDKTLSGSISNAGVWTFNKAVLASAGVAVDTLSGYTGGGTPLRILTGSSSVNTRIIFATNSVDHVEIPLSGNLRPTVDSAVSLGEGSKRWSVVYSATGAINTSDERAKQDIASLDDVEKRVAVALKGLVKKFRFKDAVQVKGDAARIHVGVIAQEVIAAFQGEGLDANGYGILCYDEWDAELDEDGKEVSPAGNRYGVRYEELLAFILAAL